jgi:putative Mg2+ transporter-C (MgtC) family protein
MINEFVAQLTVKDILIRMAMAVVIGGVIGYEREYKKRPAGFRTHILVCLGAALVSLISDQLRINVFSMYLANPAMGSQVRTDVGRIGAQVISGIGFLGAGTIMSDKGSVKGLTTAASIWATGCIGLAVGWGFYLLAVVAAAAILMTLIFMKVFETKYIGRRLNTKLLVKYKTPIANARIIVSTYKVFDEYALRIRDSEKDHEENSILYTVMASKGDKLMAVTGALLEIAEIGSVEVLD